MANIFSEEALYKKSPQELTALLYEACIDNLEQAIEEINEKNYVIANKHLQKTNDILRRLGAGLNYEAGIIADQLDALYNYMADRLVEANIKKDISIIKEVLDTLQPIVTSWNEALKKKSTQPRLSGLQRKAMAYEQNIMVDKN